jgi:cellobiose phosphorylase
METGDLSILDEVVPYYDGGEGTVFEHLTKSIEFSMNHLGKDNIPLMLGSDWNDCLDTVCRKGKGESVMVAEQVVLGARMMVELCKLKGVDSSYFEKVYNHQKDTINDKMYDGDRYVRAVTDGGVRLGEKAQKCGKIWLNSNSWAVLSGVADTERGNACMDNVMKYLNSDIGLVKQYPALELNYPTKEEQISWATPGIGENGGVFCHANTWAIMAYCMLGRGNDAYQIYSELLPDNVISKVGVERYITEPYIYSSNIRALYAPCGGEAAVSWVTGTSTWMNISIQQYMCGVKPKFDGLEIKPCLPAHIARATIQRKHRNTTYTIEVFNGGTSEIEKIIVNGVEQKDCLVKPTGATMQVEIYTRSAKNS